MRLVVFVFLSLSSSWAYAIGCTFVVDSTANGEQGQNWKSVKKNGTSISYEGSYKTGERTYFVFTDFDKKDGRYFISFSTGEGISDGLGFTDGNIPFKGGGGSGYSYFVNGSKEITAISVFCGTYIEENGF